MTEIERNLSGLNGTQEDDYKAEVRRLIHLRYCYDDEIDLLQNKDEKPEEYAAYRAYVVQCKEQAKKKYMEDNE